MKVYTRQILLEKYGHSIPAPAPAQEQQPQNARKAAGEFSSINEYRNVADWLEAVAAATLGWSADLRSSVVADQIKKHLLR